MEHRTASVASIASTLSWNTYLSRTSVSSLSCAIFSAKEPKSAHGLGDVVRAVRMLNLRRYRYEDLSREEILGEGETFLVERCVTREGSVLAVKHLKTSGDSDIKTSHRRLRSAILELQIMRHPPFKAHPNITSGLGYGWNTNDNMSVPFIVVEYAAFGTLREHIKTSNPSLSHIEILLGDVASGLAALHVCGIVHGDIKLDNVLVFPSMDRPAKSLAKLTDFGHTLILNEDAKGQKQDRLVYTGTLMYNAPEVYDQGSFPIDRADLSKCDIWAFGLLVWEACIRGSEYLHYLQDKGLISNTSAPEAVLDRGDLLKIAKASIPGAQFGPPMFIRITLHKTLQKDPNSRVSDARELPLHTRWNTKNASGLQAQLALHIEAPTPTYEIFRLDNGRDISWAHQEEIFQSLERTYQNTSSEDSGRLTWQMALCYHIGFGVARDPHKASDFAQMATSSGHPVAKVFAYLLEIPQEASPNNDGRPYLDQVLLLLQSNAGSSTGMPSLVKAFYEGDASSAKILVDEGACLSLSTIDGCGPLHWLFTFRASTVVTNVVDMLRLADHDNKLDTLVNLPFCTPREIDCQWPLQLLGSPLAVSISVNSLVAVEALLRLGADPFLPVYHETQFPPEDARLQWTAFHIAAKYHCDEILECLFKSSNPQKLSQLPPIGCALSFSTSLERLAIHGPGHTEQLGRTVQIIQSVQPLATVTSNGMTALMQAIDFQDYDVAAALLHADPKLAETPFHPLSDSNIFNFPIHFAVQIASQRDVQDTLEIPKLINSHFPQFITSGAAVRDHVGRTPLHLAATGESSLVARWILEKMPDTLQIEDNWGRPALYYCASATTCELLLGRGASVNHTDKLGMTALHWACLAGASDLVSCLLKALPNLDLNNNKYGTPLHCGVISGSIDVVLALVDAGAPLNATDKMGNTAVHVAAKLQRHQILRILKRHGANTTLQNIRKRDAKSIAMDDGSLGSVGILRILQPTNEAQANRGILDVDAATLHTAPKQVADFLWSKDGVWTGVEEQVGSQVEYRQEVKHHVVNDGDEVERYAQTYDALMSAVHQAVRLSQSRKVWPLDSAHTWFIDSLVESSLAFVDGNIWHSDMAFHATEIMARTAHDLAASFTEDHDGPPDYTVFRYDDDDGVVRSSLTWYQDNMTAEWEKQPDTDSATAEEVEGSTDSMTRENCPCGNFQYRLWRHEALVYLMLHHVTQLAIITRPHGVFPGRGREEIEEMVRWELQSLYGTSADGEKSSGDSDDDKKEQGGAAARTFFRTSPYWRRPYFERPSHKYTQWRNKKSGTATDDRREPLAGHGLEDLFQDTETPPVVQKPSLPAAAPQAQPEPGTRLGRSISQLRGLLN